jgi:hypothetical protein
MGEDFQECGWVSLEELNPLAVARHSFFKREWDEIG